MTSELFKKGLGVLLGLLLISAPVWAGERIKTDGKSKESPIKVNELNFQDSGYGQPGPQAEIRISTVIRNSSKEDDLKNVLIKLNLKNMAGEAVQTWEKRIPVMKKGAVVEFDPGAVYYNYSFNNLSAGVEIEHDKVEEKDAEKDKE